MDYKKATAMKQILFGIAFTALAAMPASAGTSFPFFCDFGDGYGSKMQLSLFTEGGGSLGTQEIWWHEVGNTVLVVRDDDRNWVILAFDSMTDEAIMPYEHNSLIEGTCRVGTE